MTTLNGERLTLSHTANWRTLYDSDLVKVEVGDIVRPQVWRRAAYRVKVKEHLDLRGGKFVTAKSRVFYGESAWADAERLASDADRRAGGCTGV